MADRATWKTIGISAWITLAFAFAVVALDLHSLTTITGWAVLFVYHVVLLARGLELRRWTRARADTEGAEAARARVRRLWLTGGIGLAILVSLRPVSLALAHASAGREVARAQRAAEDLLRAPHPAVPVVWGAFQDLEGSGFKRARAVWDIGGVTDNLLALRTARFGSREVPLVIEVVRYEASPTLSLETPSGLAGYVRLAFDLHDLGWNAPVLYARIPLPRTE